MQRSVYCNQGERKEIMEQAKHTCDECGAVALTDRYGHAVGWSDVCRRKKGKGRYTNKNYCGKCSDKKKI